MIEWSGMPGLFVGGTLLLPLGLGIVGLVLLGYFPHHPRLNRGMAEATAVTSAILLILSILILMTPSRPIHYF
ncbi:MAG: hypothetical protein KC419_14440, partial [Anaerolineales bacterium]|nr:hypothetical protein [Anaerolineales bacterium]